MPAAALDWLELPPGPVVLPSSFRVDEAAQASIGLAGLAAAAFHHRRGGPVQGVSVGRRHAAMEFRSERLLRLDGGPPPDLWDALTGLYAARDGWVRLHTIFPHHRAGVLRLLGCAADRERVARAVAERDAVAFEEEASAAGMCVTAFRTAAAWAAHPQSAALAGLPVVGISRIGDAPPECAPVAARPLGGVRVLDATRVIAGPVAGRTLAAHGAEVLALTAPHLPFVPPLVMDNNRGKRSASLDLRQSDDAVRLEVLVRQADVFLQGYRPGGLAGLGFGPERVAALRPGIVYGSLNAYGPTGPWAGRRGFDSLVQTATGLNADEMEATGEVLPRVLPAQALDHATGYLLAFGVMAALHRRAEEGGSWHVQVSLARTGQWLRGLGRVDGLGAADPGEMPDLMEVRASGFGELQAIRHAAKLDVTPAWYALPSTPLGSAEARF